MKITTKEKNINKLKIFLAGFKDLFEEEINFSKSIQELKK